MADIVLEAGPKMLNLNDDEMRLMDEISFQQPEKTVPVKVKTTRAPPFARKVPRAPPIIDESIGLDAFVNPGKRTRMEPPPEEEWDGGEDDEDGFQDDQQQQQHQMPQSEMPSEGYKTIADEKADLLNKITRLTKKGMQTNVRLTSYSDIEEIRTEYKRMVYAIEVDRSIKFSRRMLVACVTGLEFLNDKFDPFDLQLGGWSNNIMENVDDYDGVFEDLYNKYKTKIDVAPEVKLIMMVGGSAMMFHLTNSMFKAAVPNVSQVMNQNPELVRNMMDAVQRSQQQQQQQPSAMRAEPPAPGIRREMRGPGMDFGSLMGMMGPPPPANSRPVVRDDESVSDIVSVDGGGASGDVREVSVKASGKTRGAKRPKKNEVSI
jgi:hypothetical protein